jgi:superfamily II DNA or RNA helicase
MPELPPVMTMVLSMVPGLSVVVPLWNRGWKRAVSAAELAETALRRFFSPGTASRGDEYYAAGRVRRIERGPDGAIVANVDGSRVYQVALQVMGDELMIECDCPAFERYEDECKHIWAAIRAASARRLLPERKLMLALDIVDTPDDFDGHFHGANVVDMTSRRAFPGAVARRDVRPAWQKFLDALPRRTAARGEERPLPEEIVYAIYRTTYSHSISLEVLGRSRKKNGEWMKWKRFSIREDDLRLLPEPDRQNLALLSGASYSNRVESTVHLSESATAWWIERLARAGKLYLFAGEPDPWPVRWDDGPPWNLRVAVVNDAAAAMYRVVGEIERDGERLPLDQVLMTLPEIVITHSSAARFHAGERAAWLPALRANHSVEIPHADTERFRSALLYSPLADVQLPDELGLNVLDVPPRPLLALRSQADTSELFGALAFIYAEWRVAHRSAEPYTTIGAKVIRRNRAAEERMRARLSEVGVITVSDGYRVRLQQLEDVVRKLSGEGWTIEIDSAPVHLTHGIDLEIESSQGEGIDWFDLNVHATFGELRVELPELLSAADANRSLLRLPDGSYGILPMSWSESLAPVLELGKRHGGSVRFRPAQALLIDALTQSKHRKTDQAFTDFRQRIADASPEPRQEPPTLTAELRPYQRAGLGWLEFLRTTGLGGCLADDMGLGKTVQTLALLEQLRADGGTRPSLVVAPRSLLFNWAAEAKRFAPQLRILEHLGPDRANNDFTAFDVVLTTYATMRLDIEMLSAVDFEYVILDEAQAIKNASSQVAKASRLLGGRHRLALSGTPIENHLGELWSLFVFLNPGLLGSMRSFARTFAAKNTSPERREALARGLRPLLLRRTKEQVAPELPERTEQTLYCELEGKQKKLYDELRDQYRNFLLGRIRKSGIDKSRMQILEALLRLRQAACAPALIDADTDAPSAKVELLINEVRDVLASGHRALIFSQFTSFLGIVGEALQKEHVHYLYLDGKTRDRQSLVEHFQSADGPPLFLISLKAGGLGLNLTNADYIFLLDPWWNPAVEAQAIDRAHRIGRLKPVVAYRLIARDTVEEKILELQARKRELAESIISEDNSVLRKLEVEDLELLLG